MIGLSVYDLNARKFAPAKSYGLADGEKYVGERGQIGLLYQLRIRPEILLLQK